MIQFVFEGVPPSSNHAYVNLPRGGRTLSAEGRKFKAETRVYLTQKYRKELLYMRPNEPYCVAYTFTVKDLLTKSYGQKNGAKSRYKIFDTSNRIKLLEDVIKEVTGVDDSNTLTLLASKRQGDRDKTEVRIWALEREAPPTLVVTL